MRLEGVINHVLRRRILRIERQLIPKALRSSDAPSERTVIDESVSTFGQRQEAAPPAAAASFLHRWQQGYGGRQMLAIPEMPGVAGRGFHYQDGALLSGQQMTCWPAGQEEGLGTSSEARSGLAGTTTQENDLTAAVAGLLGALSSQESEGSRASHRHPAINGISKQNQHPSHWMPVVAGRHLQPGGAGLSGQQMHSWPAGGSAPSCSSGDTAGGGASEAAGQVRSAMCCCSASTCPRNKVLSASSPCAPAAARAAASSCSSVRNCCSSVHRSVAAASCESSQISNLLLHMNPLLCVYVCVMCMCVRVCICDSICICICLDHIMKLIMIM